MKIEEAIEAQCERLETQAQDWEKDIRDHPNPVLDPAIKNIIEGIRETISLLKQRHR